LVEEEAILVDLPLVDDEVPFFNEVDDEVPLFNEVPLVNVVPLFNEVENVVPLFNVVPLVNEVDDEVPFDLAIDA
jgi:hypothetical protein